MGICISAEEKKKQIAINFAKDGFVARNPVIKNLEIAKWKVLFTDFANTFYKENKIDVVHCEKLAKRLKDVLEDEKKEDPHETNRIQQLLVENYEPDENLVKIDEVINIIDKWLKQIEQESAFYKSERDEKVITVNMHKTINDMLLEAENRVDKSKAEMMGARGHIEEGIAIRAAAIEAAIAAAIVENKRKEEQDMKDVKAEQDLKNAKEEKDLKDAKVKLNLDGIKLTMETEDERKFIMALNTMIKYSEQQGEFKRIKDIKLKDNFLAIGKDYNIDVGEIVSQLHEKDEKDHRKFQYDGSVFDNAVKANVLQFKIGVYGQLIEIHKKANVDYKLLEETSKVFEKEYETLTEYHDSAAITNDYSNDERYIFAIACMVKQVDVTREDDVIAEGPVRHECIVMLRDIRDHVGKEMDDLYGKIKKLV